MGAIFSSRIKLKTMFQQDTDTIAVLKENLRLCEDYDSETLRLLEAGDSRYIKDLRVNFQNVLKSDHLTKKEGLLIALAVAVNDRNEVLIRSFEELAKDDGATAEEIADTVACASLLVSNNVTYRFRHFLNDKAYDKMPLRIKMNIMRKPSVGREFFELLSLVISSVNGCEMCSASHEQSLVDMETDEERIWDAVRLAGVVCGMTKVIN